MKTTRAMKWSFLTAAAIGAAAAATPGCELLVNFDRNKIPQEASVVDGTTEDGSPDGPVTTTDSGQEAAPMPDSGEGGAEAGMPESGMDSPAGDAPSDVEHVDAPPDTSTPADTGSADAPPETGTSSDAGDG